MMLEGSNTPVSPGAALVGLRHALVFPSATHFFRAEVALFYIDIYVSITVLSYAFCAYRLRKIRTPNA